MTPWCGAVARPPVRLSAMAATPSRRERLDEPGDSTLQYVIDKAGSRTAVILPIAEFEELLEDLDDLAAVAERRDEPTVSHEEFVAELKRDGKL